MLSYIAWIQIYNPSASASQSAGIPSVYHHTQFLDGFETLRAGLSPRYFSKVD